MTELIRLFKIGAPWIFGLVGGAFGLVAAFAVWPPLGFIILLFVFSTALGYIIEDLKDT